ncbi:hypothetical protein ACFQZW_13030 [Lutibacter aestuarii]|uniref:Uncharacterized protein n=1 Tax=Lutibacter aestuarii TaxID=861111 RepID=A0ABW2ZAL7_9FLAO
MIYTEDQKPPISDNLKNKRAVFYKNNVHPITGFVENNTVRKSKFTSVVSLVSTEYNQFKNFQV